MTQLKDILKESYRDSFTIMKEGINEMLYSIAETKLNGRRKAIAENYFAQEMNEDDDVDEENEMSLLASRPNPDSKKRRTLNKEEGDMDYEDDDLEEQRIDELTGKGKLDAITDYHKKEKTTALRAVNKAHRAKALARKRHERSSHMDSDLQSKRKKMYRHEIGWTKGMDLQKKRDTGGSVRKAAQQEAYQPKHVEVDGVKHVKPPAFHGYSDEHFAKHVRRNPHIYNPDKVKKGLKK